MKRPFSVGLAALAVSLSGTALANTATFEDVVINLNAGIQPKTFVLELVGVQDSLGTWKDAYVLDAVSLGNLGVTGATWVDPHVPVAAGTRELSNGTGGGCTGGNSGKLCWDAGFSVPVSNQMTMTFAYTGGSLMLDAPPELKLLFRDANGQKVGSLYSAPVPVPEPETYAMLLAGLAAIAFVVRRRKG